DLHPGPESAPARDALAHHVDRALAPAALPRPPRSRVAHLHLGRAALAEPRARGRDPAPLAPEPARARLSFDRLHVGRGREPAQHRAGREAGRRAAASPAPVPQGAPALTGLNAETWREVVAEASRAPSVHNVQPTRWRLGAADRVELLRALDRSLPAADPSGRDVRASVGAAFEGTVLALSRRGLGVGGPALGGEPAGPGLVRVAVARLIEGVPEDPLAAWMEKRRAFRGVFPRPAPELAQALRGLAARDTIVVTERDAIATLAREY